ncbi:MAG: hypothetical protein KME17_08695 [Cyanosarcina radialis HA8281-LM2]|jgi:hypothetical protein|nr:hypothetical protein [Cyanosarcina radialis HA8281-LM2]
MKTNRAYVVSQENWRGFGISGANKILDDLYKYLSDTLEVSRALILSGNYTFIVVLLFGISIVFIVQQ